MAESRFLKFTQHLPTALEPRFVSIRSDTIRFFFTKRVGDLFCICIGNDAGADFEVNESYEEVEKMILEALARDRLDR